MRIRKETLRILLNLLDMETSSSISSIRSESSSEWTGDLAKCQQEVCSRMERSEELTHPKLLRLLLSPTGFGKTILWLRLVSGHQDMKNHGRKEVECE
jgi:hypothetical protein